VSKLIECAEVAVSSAAESSESLFNPARQGALGVMVFIAFRLFIFVLKRSVTGAIKD
jgi:hypothetical protein